MAKDMSLSGVCAQLHSWASAEHYYCIEECEIEWQTSKFCCYNGFKAFWKAAGQGLIYICKICYFQKDVKL